MAAWPYNTARWRKLRLAKLARQPLCYACKLRGRTVLAVAVDHITPISKGGAAFPSLDGLMGLCERCHNEKTSGHDKRDPAHGRRFKGFDVNGNPIDPADAWHGGPSNHGNRTRARPTPPLETDLLANHSQKDWVI